MNTMKFLGMLFGGLLVLTIIAIVWSPHRDLHGKIPLVWVSDNSPIRARQVAAFNKENPDLALRLDYANTGTRKIILQCGSGVGPDIFDYGDGDIGVLVESGVLLDVSEAAARMGFSAEKNGWPGGKDTFTYQGRQYGFPCNTGTSILIYNKNVFDYLGIPYPEGLLTWEEFITLAQQITSIAESRPEHGRRIYAVSGIGWRTFFDSLHGEFFTRAGQLNIAGSPELQKAFAMHRTFFFTHQFSPTRVESKVMSSQGGWGSGQLNQFAVGRFAMIVTGHWSLIAFRQAYHQQNESLESAGIRVEDIKNPLERPLRLGAVLVPHFAGHPPSYRVQSRVAGINAQSPHRDEALRFLRYLAGPTYSRQNNEATDWLPGNPKYVNLGFQPGPPALAQLELQKATKQAMAHGFVQRRSPFLLGSDVVRALGAQISRLESNPSLSIKSLLQAADANLKNLMHRNLMRDPALKKLYAEKFGETALEKL